MNPDRKNNTLPVEMDSINTKETDLLITRTPFYLDTGWELVTENKNLISYAFKKRQCGDKYEYRTIFFGNSPEYISR